MIKIPEINFVQLDRIYDPLLVPLLQEFSREVEFGGIDVGSSTIEKEAFLSLDEIKRKKNICLLAFSGKKLVGFQATHRYTNDGDEYRTEGSLEFTQSYVLPEFRRRGIGNRMKSICLEQAERDGITKVIAAIERENEPSIGVHQKLGFKMVGEYEGGIGHIYVVYKKELK